VSTYYDTTQTNSTSFSTPATHILKLNRTEWRQTPSGASSTFLMWQNHTTVLCSQSAVHDIWTEPTAFSFNIKQPLRQRHWELHAQWHSTTFQKERASYYTQQMFLTYVQRLSDCSWALQNSVLSSVIMES